MLLGVIGWGQNRITDRDNFSEQVNLKQDLPAFTRISHSYLEMAANDFPAYRVYREALKQGNCPEVNISYNIMFALEFPRPTHI